MSITTMLEPGMVAESQSAVMSLRTQKMELRWLPRPSEDDDSIRKRLVEAVDAESTARDDEHELHTVYVYLTRKCNLACAHCYIVGVGHAASDHDLNLETLTRLIEQARVMGVRRVKVSGGEPFLHPSALELLEHLDSLGLEEILLETNGAVLQSNIVERLSRIRGLQLFVSLDHIEARKHDAFRGKPGAFAMTSAALKRLGESDLTSTVTTVANGENFDRIQEIIDTVFSWGIDRHRTLLNIHPLGNARDHRENALTLDECEELVTTLLASDHFRSGRAYMTLPPALSPLDRLGRLTTCGWGTNVLGILSTGQITMCSASYGDPEMIAGNALEMPLNDIWTGPFFQRLREVGQGDVQGVCANCVFYRVCRGVCKMSSYSHYGVKNGPYPLCQEFYNLNAFPTYALVDPERECSFRASGIGLTRRAREYSRALGQRGFSAKPEIAVGNSRANCSEAKRATAYETLPEEAAPRVSSIDT